MTALAPMLTSLSTKCRRLSNIFSKKRTVPSAWVAIATRQLIMSLGNCGQGPSAMTGMAWLKSGAMRSRSGARISMRPGVSVNGQPNFSKTRRAIQ